MTWMFARPFCNTSRETPNHPLLLCQFSSSIWSASIHWWNMVWVSPCNLVALLQSWSYNKFKNLERLYWQACFYVVLWTFMDRQE